MVDVVPLDRVDRKVMCAVGREVLRAVGLGALVDCTLLRPNKVDMVLAGCLREGEQQGGGEEAHNDHHVWMDRDISFRGQMFEGRGEGLHHQNSRHSHLTEVHATSSGDG